MGSRLGRRVVHFANLPIKLLMPSSITNISEISLKTIPSATKIEIKRVLESLYGFEVEKVTTLNMEGKKKKGRGGLLIAKPDYKKAYVTLRNPLSISPELYPIKMIKDEKEIIAKQAKKSGVVEDPEPKTPHWLDEKKVEASKFRKEKYGRGPAPRVSHRNSDSPTTKFPWSSMKSFAR